MRYALGCIESCSKSSAGYSPASPFWYRYGIVTHEESSRCKVTKCERCLSCLECLGLSLSLPLYSQIYGVVKSRVKIDHSIPIDPVLDSLEWNHHFAKSRLSTTIHWNSRSIPDSLQPLAWAQCLVWGKFPHFRVENEVVPPFSLSFSHTFVHSTQVILSSRRLPSAASSI